MYKIYKDNNYITVIDIKKNEWFYGHAKDVFVDKSNKNTPQYTIKNVKNFKENLVLEIGNIFNENDTAYTQSEWETFYKENTGFNTASGGSGAVEGVEILSTGETGGSKFLGENGDGTSSWKSIPTASAPIPTAYANLAALVAVQGVQTINYIYEVTDGSGFTGVDSGVVWVKYKGTTNGDETDYTWESRPSGGGSSTVTEDTGTTITFTADTFWNNLTYLTSGNLTLDLTGAVVGTSAWVWCDKYIPTISGETYLISGTPSASKLNIYKMVYTGAQTDDYDIDIVVDNKIYLNTPTITLTENVADELTLSNYAVAGADTYTIKFNTVEQTYTTLAAMFADQVGQTSGQVQYVTAEDSYYEYDGTTVGDISDYTTITSTEIGTAAAVTTPAYNGTDTSYTHTGRTVGTRFIYFVSCSGAGYLDSLYGYVEGTSAAGFTFTAQSPDNFFQLPLVSTGTYNFTIYVDGSPGDTITTWNDANTDIDLGDTSSHEIELRGTVTGWAFNNTGDKTYIYDISNWGSLQLGIGDASIPGFFYGCSNLSISATDVLVLNTTSMRNCFNDTTSLGNIPSIGSWDFSLVTDMQGCFKNSTVSASGLNNINVSSVTDFRECFDNADSMTSTLSGWDVSSGTDFFEMFRNSSGANPDPTSWDVSNATTLQNIFQSVSASFDRDLSGWDVTSATGLGLFLINTTPTISTPNMDATLISWAEQSVNTGVTFKLGASSTVTGTVADSGTTDGTTANRLVDSTQNFFSTVAIGDGVYNSTDGTYALVTNIVSDTVLQLNNDIMTSGENYTIYNNAAAKAVCKLASTYNWTVTFGGFV